MNSFILLMLLGLFCNVRGALYAIVTDFSGNDTQTTVWTVSVDPTSGSFTQVVENFIYVGSSATIDGISAYDQQKDLLYYSTDFEAPFVYSVDVQNKVLLPPISINSESVYAINWDGTNQQVLILGVFPDNSAAIYTYPYVGPSQELFNFTEQNLPAPQTTFLDWTKGVYYFIYYNPSDTTYYLGSFPIATPTKVITTALNFAKGFAPDYLFLDSTTGILFGVGINITALDYLYFKIGNGGATQVVDIGLKGVVTAATYDPTANRLYLGFVGNIGTALVTVDTTATKVLSQVKTLNVIEDLQVTYKV